jgi:hypothetical protein
MKSSLRENRTPKGTRAKVERIISDMRTTGHDLQLPKNPSGAMIFARWKASQGQGRR